MQYSPNNAIMYVSMVDAGTVEFLRGLGKEIVSSADLVSQFEAVLSDEQIASHGVAQRAIDAILAEGWQEIGRRLRPALAGAGEYTEFDHVQWLSEAMRREGLVWENGPNVSVNANCSDSHYEPTAEHSAPIREGDFLLIDIWGAWTSRAASSTTSPGRAWWAASLPHASNWSLKPCAMRATPRFEAVEQRLCARAARSAATRPTTRRAR